MHLSWNASSTSGSSSSGSWRMKAAGTVSLDMDLVCIGSVQPCHHCGQSSIPQTSHLTACG